MNFLAHFHLAWPDGGLIAGGLEGDFYRGPIGEDLDPALARGIKLHRAIDAYTDSHPVIVELRRQFPPSIRRYAGILIDLSFDHYLTVNWSRYGTLALRDFNQSVYQTLAEHETQLSPGARRMMKRLVEYDILNCYHDWNAVTATATRVGERFRRGNPLLNVHVQLEPVRDKLEPAFLDFYPQLRTFSAAGIALPRKTP